MRPHYRDVSVMPCLWQPCLFYLLLLTSVVPALPARRPMASAAPDGRTAIAGAPSDRRSAPRDGPHPPTPRQAQRLATTAATRKLNLSVVRRTKEMTQPCLIYLHGPWHRREQSAAAVWSTWHLIISLVGALRTDPKR